MVKKSKLEKMIKNKDKDKRLKIWNKRSSIFDYAQMSCMPDPWILTTPAFKLIEEDFKDAIPDGPTYICDIC